MTAAHFGATLDFFLPSIAKYITIYSQNWKQFLRRCAGESPLFNEDTRISHQHM